MVPQIAAGYYHNAALQNDGAVWAWGYNGFGQLGVGTTVESTIPLRVEGLSGVRSVAAGFFHTVALKGDGTVWTWGDNGFEQLGLGDGSVATSSLPLQVAGLTGVTAIAAAGAHTLVLKRDGTVWVWGWNAYGQLGIGSNKNASVPMQVPGLHGVTAIAAGYFHSMALNDAGAVWAWGYNGHGQLGNGTLDASTLPMQVPRLNGIIALAGGGGHTLALKNDGNLWAWGLNSYGQLGNGTTIDSSIPLQVSEGGGIKAIAAGFFHSLALTNGGMVKGWGYNGFGQLGNGSSANAISPIVVAGLSGIAAISADNNHSLALNNDGQVSAWGLNDDGQLGNASHLGSNVAAPVHGLGEKEVLTLGVSSYQDVWNNPSEPGWGVGIIQHGSTLFASWHTYDANGAAIWLVIPGGAWTGSTNFSGTLYSTEGQNTSTPFSPGQVVLTPVGSADFSFGDVNHATLSYTYGDVAGQRTLTRFVFDASGDTPGVNYSDIWWMPSESGWGVTITQQFKTIFANWRTYDANGRAIRFLLPGGAWINATTYGGTLYRTASSPTGAALSQGTVTTTAVGSAMLSFSDANNAVLSYNVEGVVGTKTITRLPF